VAAPHPPDPAQAGLPARRDLAPPAAHRGGPDQELGLRAAARRPRPRRLPEIHAQGGEASVCEARFVDGLTDAQIEALFHAARGAEYAAIAKAARELTDAVHKAKAEWRAEIAGDAARLRRRLDENLEIDLGAPGREPAEAALATLWERLHRSDAKPARPVGELLERAQYQRRVWVTRKGIHVDRMASAWLIRRFIDRDARFKYVPAKGHRPQPGEVRFDMFEAELTHEGDACTFEVLLARFGLGKDPALAQIAELVHELDVRDGKFERDDLAGFGNLVAGIALAHRDDEERLERATAMLDDLYTYFRRRKG
jgi:hypothetical protein